MATFSKATFNTVKYAAARPTYPNQLFRLVFDYHQLGRNALTQVDSPIRTDKESGARWDKAVDLGCGTGQATAELTPFRSVIGVDPSTKMLDGARNYIALSLGPVQATSGKYDFVQSEAENLKLLEDASVDLVISAQASHWFNWQKLWPELARVVRSNGTIALWGYSEFRFSRYPTLTHLINEYSQGKNPATSLGPHWEQPGRSVVDGLLMDIPSGNVVVPEAFDVDDRLYFAGPHAPNVPPEKNKGVILRKQCTWSEFEGYLRSFSSFHTFQEKYPEDKAREDGDIVTRFVKNLQQEMGQINGGGVSKNVEIEWPLALILTKRK